MNVSASIHHAGNLQEVMVETNGLSKQISIPPKPGGFGSSVNGAELLLLSIATCFCNDVYREANKRGISIEGVNVVATGEFGAEGEPGSNFQYKAEVISAAPADIIRQLINDVNEIAEIHKTLRNGISVTLV